MIVQNKRQSANTQVIGPGWSPTANDGILGKEIILCVRDVLTQILNIGSIKVSLSMAKQGT